MPNRTSEAARPTAVGSGRTVDEFRRRQEAVRVSRAIHGLATLAVDHPGLVAEAPAGLVLLRSRIGGSRVLDLLSGEQLPRIC